MKKIFCICIALMLVFASANAAEPSDWAAWEIDKTLINGCDDFSAPATKAEVARLALRACLKEGVSFEVKIENSFEDLDDPVVLTAAELGLIEGEDEKTFSPEKQLTRYEVLEIVYNAANEIYGIEEADFLGAAREAEDFEDYSYSEDTAQIVGFGMDWGIIRGVNSNALALSAPCSMEQALVMISRCIG